jgi:hypothetical protein
MNSKHPDDDITLVGTPTLSKGKWRAEYRARLTIRSSMSICHCETL